MTLKPDGIIEIPNSVETLFDHGAFEPKSRRVFVAHTARNCVEVIDHDTRHHLATLPDFPEAAGVVADQGQVLVTNRGAARLRWIDAETLTSRAVFGTGLRPNGVSFVSRLGMAVVACIGDETHRPILEAIQFDGRERWSADLPGRPRWCVTDAEGTRVFLAIREPSMIFVAELPELGNVWQWPLPSGGAHGLDIDHASGCLYVACDGGALVEVAAGDGQVRRQWPLAGAPDATFFNPVSGLVHIAIGDPGEIQSVDTRTGACTEIMTAAKAKTTALVPPEHLYVFSPAHSGVFVLREGERIGSSEEPFGMKR
jgi:DNA-binding beta-propeller fold protein YncE